ncbi:MAG: hypothetical protein NTZ38_01750, partial [Candidatus Taylorbacteria bacterium]|nr:hypothetical protein [Candidatus Taylorbacteria bacterium]
MGTSKFVVNNFNGNVGIGTASPVSLLDVNGAGTFATGTVAVPSIAFRTNTNTGIWTSGSGSFNFSVNGVERMNLDRSGAGLYITGPSDPTGNSSLAQLDAVDTTGGYLNLQNSSGAVAAKIRGYALSGIQAYFTAGYIGIGTVSPANQLDIRIPSSATAKTIAFSTLNLANTATSTTASINKTGLQISSTGTWNGANANNIGLYVSSVTGGINNYDAVFNGGGNVGIGTTSPGSILSIGNTGASAVANFTTGTSTIYHNLDVQGTLHGQTLYSGDLYFANNFRFTESPLNTQPQGLILQNQNGGNLFTVDDSGNVTITGDICANGAQCFGKSLNRLTNNISSLSDNLDSISSTTNL